MCLIDHAMFLLISKSVNACISYELIPPKARENLRIQRKNETYSRDYIRNTQVKHLVDCAVSFSKARLLFLINMLIFGRLNTICIENFIKQSASL